MNDQKDYQEYIKELGKKIKLYRIMKEMSQQDLEDKTGVSKEAYPDWNKGNLCSLRTYSKFSWHWILERI